MVSSTSTKLVARTVPAFEAHLLAALDGGERITVETTLPLAIAGPLQEVDLGEGTVRIGGSLLDLDRITALHRDGYGRVERRP